MAINGKRKGSAGEREFCKWLKDKFELKELPKRDLSQTRDKGADVNFSPFAFEIKRQEKSNLLYDWWCQVKESVNNKNCSSYGLEPVVAFRKNRQKWEFLIRAENLKFSINRGFIRLEEYEFVEWAKCFVENAKISIVVFEEKLIFKIPENLRRINE